MMKVYSILFLLTAALTSLALADEDSVTSGRYRFNGRTYKLDPYSKPVPKTHARADFGILSELPDQVDLTDIQTVVKDQSSRGSCAYFAATALFESLIKKGMEDKKDINISEEYLIWYTKAVLGQASHGDGSNAASDFGAFDNGFLFERELPYQPSWFAKGLPCQKHKEDNPTTPRTCYSHRKPSESTLNKVLKFDSVQTKYVPSSSFAIMATLASGYPVIVGLPVNQNGWDSTSGHCIYNEQLDRECNTNPDMCGGHAVLLVGYDNTSKVFKFKNSWGKDWGKSGYGTLPFEYIDNYASTSVSGTISGVNLPDNFDVFPEAKVQNVFSSVDPAAEQSDGLKNIVTNTGAEVTYTPNALLYISAFLMVKKDNLAPDADPLSDDTYDMVQVPAQLQEEHGEIVRGVFFKSFGKNDTLSFDRDSAPATTQIPYEVLDSSKLSGKETFSRISIYVHDDQNAWKKLHREYIPIALDLQ